MKLDGKTAGKIPVKGFEWKWVAMDQLIKGQPAGTAELEFETGVAGIALDNILLTNDPDFVPENPDNTPCEALSAPGRLRIAQLVSGEQATNMVWRGYTIKPPWVKLTWKPSAAPQGVRYYNIYRGGEKGLEPSPPNLLGSTSDTFFIDPELKNGHRYYYRVVAVDNWNNRSGPSKELSLAVE